VGHWRSNASANIAASAAPAIDRAPRPGYTGARALLCTAYGGTDRFLSFSPRLSEDYLAPGICAGFCAFVAGVKLARR